MLNRPNKSFLAKYLKVYLFSQFQSRFLVLLQHLVAGKFHHHKQKSVQHILVLLWHMVQALQSLLDIQKLLHSPMEHSEKDVYNITILIQATFSICKAMSLISFYKSVWIKGMNLRKYISVKNMQALLTSHQMCTKSWKN